MAKAEYFHEEGPDPVAQRTERAIDDGTLIVLRGTESMADAIHRIVEDDPYSILSAFRSTEAKNQ